MSLVHGSHPRRVVSSFLTVALVAAGVQLISAPRGAAAAEVDCASVPWMNRAHAGRAARARPARRVVAGPEAALARRALGERPDADDLHHGPPARGAARSVHPDHVHDARQVPCTPTIQYTDAPSAIAGAGAGVTAYPANVSLSAAWDTGARPREGRRDRPRGVAQAAQRPAGPRHRERPRPAQRPYVGVPRRGPGARRPAGRRVHARASAPTTTSRSSRSSSTSSRTSRRPTATTAPPTWTDVRCARSTPSRTRSRSTAATSARSCAPSTRSTTTGPAATSSCSTGSSSTRSGSTAGWLPTSARGTT